MRINWEKCIEEYLDGLDWAKCIEEWLLENPEMNNE